MHVLIRQIGYDIQRIARGPHYHFIEDFNTEDIQGTYIVGTKRGIFALQKSKLFRVLNGHFYGITKKGRHLFAFELCHRVMGQKGRVIKIGIDDKCKLISVQPFIEDLSYGCHQIDVRDSDLFVTDTYHNRILQFNLEDGQLQDEFYPIGRLDPRKGRESRNYGHINSIFFDKERVYLFCHNESQKTNRNSEILVLDKAFNVLETIRTEARNGHNILKFENDLYFCDSIGGSLFKNEQPIFKSDYFTRGISLSHDYLVVGGSEYAKRNQREKAAGNLSFLDTTTFENLFSIEVPGMVQEIRRIDDTDHSMSDLGI